MNKDPSNTLSGKLDERPQESNDRWLWIIQELFIDVFARLGAGIIFLFLAGLALADPLNIWLQVYSGASYSNFIKITVQPLKETERIPLLSDTALPLFVTIAVFFLAFLIGLILSRLDIKTPDRLSFQRRAKCLWWDYLRDQASENKYKNPERWIRINRAFLRFWKIAWNYLVLMHLFDDFPRDNGIRDLFINDQMCTCKADCDYPYHYLKSYLTSRGYPYLAKIVPWDEPESIIKKDTKRSRDFITLLKFRNYYYGREGSMRLAHTEAIIRLLSSVWWAARIISWVSFISVIIMIYYNFGEPEPSLLSIVPPLPMLALIISASLRWGITNQFHDLRMREVFQVLATTYTLSHHNPDWFDDIPTFKIQKSPIQNHS